MKARTITVSWEDPLPAAEQAQHLSGRDYLTALLEGKLPPPPINNLLGFTFAALDEGFAAFEFEPGEQHYNPLAVVHGGLACTMLDSAMGCAVHSVLPAGTGYTTLELKVNLVRAITMGTGTLRSEGRVVHSGRRMATSEGRVFDKAGKLYAHGTTTCMILRAT